MMKKIFNFGILVRNMCRLRRAVDAVVEEVVVALGRLTHHKLGVSVELGKDPEVNLPSGGVSLCFTGVLVNLKLNSLIALDAVHVEPVRNVVVAPVARSVEESTLQFCATRIEEFQGVQVAVLGCHETRLSAFGIGVGAFVQKYLGVDGGVVFTGFAQSHVEVVSVPVLPQNRTHLCELRLRVFTKLSALKAVDDRSVIHF